MERKKKNASNDNLNYFSDNEELEWLANIVPSLLEIE